MPLFSCMCPFANCKKYQDLLCDIWRLLRLFKRDSRRSVLFRSITASPRPSASHKGVGRQRLLFSHLLVSGCKSTAENVHRTDFLDNFVHCSENSAGPGDPSQRRGGLHPVPQVPGEQRYVDPAPVRTAALTARGRPGALAGMSLASSEGSLKRFGFVLSLFLV